MTNDRTMTTEPASSLADASDTSKCIECGAAISSTAKFCSECGANQAKATPAQIKCIFCNAEISNYAKFCEECGTTQTREAKAVQTVEAVASEPPSEEVPTKTNLTEAGSAEEKSLTRTKFFKIYVIAAAVIVLAVIGAWSLQIAERQKVDNNYKRGLAGENGQGVPKGDVQAVTWYRKAADEGNADAQYRLGEMYENGQGSLVKDDAQAVSWFWKAADQGQANAEYWLGVMYENGRGGLTKDHAQAVSWFTKAAEQGFAQARDALAQQQLNQHEPRSRNSQKQGEETTFSELFARVQHAHSLASLGKRFRFRACVTHRMEIYSGSANSASSQFCLGNSLDVAVVPDFDSKGQYEEFLRKPEQIRTVICSSGPDGKIHIHGFM